MTLDLPEDKRIVIIGCGRSGTKFISKHLGLIHEKHKPERNPFKSIGRFFGLIDKEKIPDKGIACWQAVVDDNSYYTIESTDYVLHQVRNPIDTISSCHAIKQKESWNLIISNIKEINEDDSLLLKCMKYWYYWNKIAEKRASKTYRIEDINSETPSDTNTRRDLDLYIKVSWSDMEKENSGLTSKIKSLAIKYGYNL